MRFAALLLTCLLAGLAGCTETPSDPAPAQEQGGDEPLPPLPANFTHEVDVTGGVDVYNFLPGTPVGGGGPCSADVSSCSKFPFTLNRTANITVTLDWTMDGYDFDVYLIDEDGTDVSEGAGALGATSASIAPHEEFALSGLDAGDYEVWVSHWLVPQDTYTLVVEFT